MARRDWADVLGHYVLILDDDDLMNDNGLIATLKTYATPVWKGRPNLFMVRMDHGPWGILPDDNLWGQPPKSGRQGCSSVIPSRDIFMRAVTHYQPRYNGDFDFVNACFSLSENTIWLNTVATRVQQVGALTQV
jgi:hypothetical protein